MNLIADVAAFKLDPRVVTNIRDPADLRSKTVATARGTTSVPVAQRLAGSVVMTGDLAAALNLLEQGQVDAILFDELPLREYEQRTGQGRVLTVSAVADENYAFAVHEGNHQLRELLNRGLLRLKQDGTYELLLKRYGLEPH